jgi:hypothetical protein
VKRKIASTVAICGVTLAGLAAAPVLPSGPLTVVDVAQAASTKAAGAGGGGGGNVSGVGERLGDLLSGWGVPILIAFAGCLLVGALASRNIGTSVVIVVVTLIGLIFLLSPTSIEMLAKGIANAVF